MGKLLRTSYVLAGWSGLIFTAPCFAAGSSEAPGRSLPVQTSSSDPRPAQADPTPVDIVALEDIVVTAERRSQNLQKVPIAVETASGLELAAAAITSTVQLNAIAPGLNIRTTNGAFNPFIRGIGTSSNIVENPVALYIDGVYIPQQREGLRELNDIQQVAVLKGPQGTLFGRNATGGVIQITTRAPSDSFRGEVGVSVDNYATVRGDAYLSGPLSDALAFSLSAQAVKQYVGYGDNLTTGNDTYKIRHSVDLRGKLRFTPTERTSITLIGDYMDRQAQANSFQPLRGRAFTLPGARPVDSRYDTRAGIDPYANFEVGGVSLTIEQDFDFAKLVSISAYRKGKGAYLMSPSADPAVSQTVFSLHAPNEMFSQELQLVSAPGAFNWMLGAYYFHNRNANLPVSIAFRGVLSPAPAAPRQIDNFGTEIAESIAPFGQFNWEFAENTTLTGGVRWTYEKRSAELSRIITFNNGGMARPPAVDASTTFDEPTFRAALSHEFSPTVLGYVSFNSGFKSGGFNITNVTNPSYLPEKLKAYEAGLKSQFLDRRVRLNVAAYYYDYTNVQVSRFANGTQTIANGAAAELYGLDVDLEAQVTPELRVSGGLALEHAKFTSFPSAAFAVIQPNGSVLLTSGSAKGNRLPLAQEVSGTLALDYRREFAAGAIDANVTANYNGDYFFEPDNGVMKQGAYVMLNASLKYTLPGERVSISLFGRNLLDEHILSFVTTQTYGFDANYAPPRTYGIAARLNF
jgi:iron complex outermembrane receptor protein